MVYYYIPKGVEHVPALLENVKHPNREVDDFAIFSIDRRPFQGEMAIRIVERVLGIDASRDPVYNFPDRGRRNFNGQQYGGYRNNHAVYGSKGGGYQGGMLGQRRNYQDYQKEH